MTIGTGKTRLAIAVLGIAILIASSYIVRGHDQDSAKRGDERGGSPSLSLPFASGVARYDPAASPAEVAQRVMESSVGGEGLVVKAAVGDISPGKTYLTGPPTHTAVVALRVDEVFAGRLPEGGDGIVLVEIDSPPKDQLDSFVAQAQEETPLGTEGIFYLWRMPPTGVYGPDVETSGAVFDEPLYRAIVQGVYLKGPGSSDVISPTEAIRYDNASLEQFLPEVTTFPNDVSRDVPMSPRN